MNNCLHCEASVKNKYCSVSCQNSHQNKIKNDKKFGQFKEFSVQCNECGNRLNVEEREYLFPQKEKYFCDRKCANKRNDDKSETKSIICMKCNKLNQINKRSRQKICNECKIKPKRRLRDIINFTCKTCNKQFQDKKKTRVFCSNSCSTKFKNKEFNMNFHGGLKSVQSQSTSRRSKNEIAFANLCIEKFSNVLTNEPIFNGWDADIIIEDIKVAILWNGKWHYEQISKSKSLSQIQNRDRIKIEEIKKSGYTPYVIKDMGKENSQKVSSEWEEFNKWILQPSILSIKSIYS